MNKNNKEFRNTATGNSSFALQNRVKTIIPEQSSLLLLGIGSGKDLKFLSQYYKVTASDFSRLLLTMYQKEYPETDFLNLDPVELETERKFDSIFSNKVLSQMNEEDLLLSLNNQLNLLNENGIAIHSFWSGNKQENHHGLTWVYYTEEKLQSLIPSQFEVIDINTYKQNLMHDSLYIVLKLKTKDPI